MIFLNKIESLHRLGLPFVIFRKPNSDTIELFEQLNDELYFFNDEFFAEGFVMAPFNQFSQKSIFLKADKAYQEKIPSFTIDMPSKKNIPFDEEEKRNHIQLIEKAIATLKEGNLKKVVLSRKISLNHKATLSEVFKKMIFQYPSAFCYLFFHPKVGIWIAATPEKLIDIQENNIYTMALAGTQPARANNHYLWKEKEKEEQQIVTDQIVNKLHEKVENLRISEVKTVKAGNVVYLCTDIFAQLKNDRFSFEIVNILHPTTAVCGFPDEEAKAFILENEPYNRSFYTGYCGVVRKENKSIDFYVNLRCMQIEENKVHIYVGGGILKESDAEAEWEETQNKAQTMFMILQ